MYLIGKTGTGKSKRYESFQSLILALPCLTVRCPEVRMRACNLACLLALCVAAAPALGGNREPVLKQIDLPHPYYYR